MRQPVPRATAGPRLCLHRTLALQALGGDQALDLGGLERGLLALLLDLALDHVVADVILLGQVEQLADLAGTLGSEAARAGGVSEALNVIGPLLDDRQGKHAEGRVDNAATGGLLLALATAAAAVARVACARGHTQKTRDRGAWMVS